MDARLYYVTGDGKFMAKTNKLAEEIGIENDILIERLAGVFSEFGNDFCEIDPKILAEYIASSVLSLRIAVLEMKEAELNRHPS